MRNSYMPTEQGRQVEWSENFSALINEGPAAYGLTEAQAAAFAAVNSTLQAAYAAAIEPTTRNKITVANKNAALKSMKVAARGLVSIIQGQPNVTDGQKIALGITVRDTKPTPAPVPSQKPFIEVAGIDGRTVAIELRQQKDKRGKPAKVAGAAIFSHVGPAAPETPDGWTFVTNTTKTTLEIPFGPSATGDTVWITAFWFNSRTQSGPSSRPVSVNLPAGGVLPKASGTLRSETEQGQPKQQPKLAA